MTNKTSIIILTHNQIHITLMCLDSIRIYTDEPYEIIVVDNGSTDETVDYLKSQPDVKAVFNDSNLGFAKGCNQGFEVATGDTILFLNNDTIVTSNWLTAMLRVLYSEDDIGAVGPVTNYASGHQKIAVGYVGLVGLHPFAQEHVTRHAGYSFDVRRIIGFCMLFKRKVLEEVGLFDELYGLGNYEDDDICLRVLNQGYRLKVVYDSYIHHFGHMTTKILNNAYLGELLMINKEKAKGKWGQDIHSLIYKAPATVTFIIPIDEHTGDDDLEAILSQTKRIAEEVIVLNAGAEPGVLVKMIELKSKVVDAGDDTPEVWWPRIVSESSKQFLFWLNPIERISADEQRKLIGLKLSLTDQVDGVSIRLQSGSGNRTDGESAIVRRTRMVRRDAPFKWDAANHQFLLESEECVKIGDNLITQRS